MGKFYDYAEKLPVLFNQLIEGKSYYIKDLTEGKLKDILGSSNPVEGVYLMYDKDVPMYVGRSKTLAQKLGTDERALGEVQATVSKKIRNINVNKSWTMKEARKYLFNNYTVKFIKIDDEILRSIFVIYVATELQTPFNSFMET